MGATGAYYGYGKWQVHVSMCNGFSSVAILFCDIVVQVHRLQREITQNILGTLKKILWRMNYVINLTILLNIEIRVLQECHRDYSDALSTAPASSRLCFDECFSNAFAFMFRYQTSSPTILFNQRHPGYQEIYLYNINSFSKLKHMRVCLY